MDIEPQIKTQYAKFFTQNDWSVFRSIADYYFTTAAILKKDDIDAPDGYQLLIRNIQKRLFLGIGCELLTKAVYLRLGYGINRPKTGPNVVYSLNAISPSNYEESETYTLNFLIDQLKHIFTFKNHTNVIRGLKVAKVFRNKEGHIAVLWHKFDPSNYSYIEDAVISIYSEVFLQELSFQISMERNESGKFRLTPAFPYQSCKD